MTNELPSEGAEKPKTGVELIAEERKRQIEIEGWTSEHDAKHDNFQLAAGAASYAAHAISEHMEAKRFTNQSPLAKFEVYWFGTDKQGWIDGWPWDGFWKPTGDPVRDLTKAGALIAAEIDRLQNQKP